MAKAAVKRTIKAPVKKPQLSRAAVKTIDFQYNGTEPLDVSVRGYTHALNWYNYACDGDQSREWLLEYLKKNSSSKQLLADVRKAPKSRVPTTIGWQARMMMNGNVLAESSMKFFNDRVQEVASHGRNTREETEDAPAAPVISIQERTQAKIQQLITDCEEAIDNNADLNIYEWLAGKEASSQAASALFDYYSKGISDHEPDEFDTRAEKKARAEKKKYWEDFVLLIDRFINNKKAVKIRKPREKKVKSAVDLVKKLTFQKEYPPLKIVSVNPGEIVGASQLWAYNTKTRKLTQFLAVGPAGLSVKGASIIGYDTEKSFTKRLRKPDVSIQQLLSAGKVTLRKFMDDINAIGAAAAGRINSDTILLRVIK